MQGSTEVVCSCINLGTELDEDLDEGCMTLAGGQMKRCEAIRVGTIDDFEHFVVLIEVLLGKSEDLHNFGPVALVDLRPVVHFDFLDILLSVLLLLRLLPFARVAFN
jgi:hypothetical protein